MMVFVSGHDAVLYTPFRVGFPSTPEIVMRLGHALIPVPRSVVTRVVVPLKTWIDVKLPKREFHAGIASECPKRT